MKNEKQAAQEPRRRTTADLLVECLEKEGVEYVFGIPGEENLEVVNALSRSKTIRFITTRHEQGAAFMADVYGRLTGKAGVCLATLGPGATNLVTGVADANCDGAPLVAITGQVSTRNMHITSHQFLDLTKMFEPITKRTKLVVGPKYMNEIVRLAFKYAENERPGATHIDLPVDVSKMEVPESETPLRRVVMQKELADRSSIQAAARLVGRADRPVILAGSAAVRAGASWALTRFAQRLKIPVVNTMMAKGIISCDSRYAMMTVGIPQKDYANKILEEADLIIAVGYDIVEFSPEKWNPTGNTAIVHISSAPADINKNYQCEVEVVGDISHSLESILEGTAREKEPVRALEMKERFTQEVAAYEDDSAFPMKPQRILSDVRKALGREDILISDVGAHKMWIGRLYECYEPNTCIISNGFATMGIGVPGAIAAKMVYPDRRVLTVTGDGGFMMNNQEMETAVRLGLNIVVLIFNDKCYGLIRWKQMDHYGQSYGVDFTNPDFVKLAEAMGCAGYRVESADQLPAILEEAFSQPRPVIVDCPVDYGENTRLTAHLREIYRTL